MENLTEKLSRIESELRAIPLDALKDLRPAELIHAFNRACAIMDVADALTSTVSEVIHSNSGPA